MKTIMIEKEINQAKLYDELLKAELITPLQSNGASRLQGNSLFIDDADDIDAINLIIDTHDPTPDQTVSSDDILRAKIELTTINTLIDLGVI